jgi:hypothetical protein
VGGQTRRTCVHLYKPSALSCVVTRPRRSKFVATSCVCDAACARFTCSAASHAVTYEEGGTRGVAVHMHTSSSHKANKHGVRARTSVAAVAQKPDRERCSRRPWAACCTVHPGGHQLAACWAAAPMQRRASTLAWWQVTVFPWTEKVTWAVSGPRKSQADPGVPA